MSSIEKLRSNRFIERPGTLATNVVDELLAELSAARRPQEV
jgi:hypothetical protein